MWIECKLLDGNPVWINTNHVIAIRPADDATVLAFVDGNYETADEEAGVVARRVIEGVPAFTPTQPPPG